MFRIFVLWIFVLVLCADFIIAVNNIHKSPFDVILRAAMIFIFVYLMDNLFIL